MLIIQGKQPGAVNEQNMETKEVLDLSFAFIVLFYFSLAPLLL